MGFEALQKKTSLSKSKRDTQVTRTRIIEKDLSSNGAEIFFSVHTPYTPIAEFCLASESPMVRRRTIEAVKKCVELAEDIGAQIVNTHLGGIVKTTSDSFKNPAVKRATLDRLKESLAVLVGWLEGRSVTLSLENLPYPLEEMPLYSPVVGIFPRDFSEILKDVNSENLAVTLDFCHLWITHKALREFIAIRNNNRQHEGVSITDYKGLSLYEREGIESLAINPFDAFVKPLCDEVAHIHVADSDGVYVPGKSKVSEGEPLGEGDLNLDALANSLRQIECCSRKVGHMMIVLEVKEANLAEPTNSLKSLSVLTKLIH